MPPPCRRAILIWFLFAFGFSPLPALAQEAQTQLFTFDYAIKPLEKEPSDVTITCLIPRTILGRQKILDIEYSKEPARVWDEGSARYASFQFKGLRAPTTLTVRIKADLYRRDLETLRKVKDPSANAAPLAEYLASEKYLEKDDAAISRAASKLRGKDTLDTLRKTMAFVRDKVKYSTYDPKRVAPGAARTLADGTGVCRDFSDLFVALCRANGIHARGVEGYQSGKITNTPKHCWVEAHVEGLGWVPFEPTQLGSPGVTFEQRQNRYLYLSWKRNDPLLEGHHFWSSRYKGGKVDVKDSFAAEPVKASAPTR